MHSSSSHRVGLGEHLRSSFEKISQSLQTISSNFPSCHIISTIRASGLGGGWGVCVCGGGLSRRPWMGLFSHFPLKLTTSRLTRNFSVISFFAATILISPPPVSNKQSGPLKRKKKKKNMMRAATLSLERGFNLI